MRISKDFCEKISEQITQILKNIICCINFMDLNDNFYVAFLEGLLTKALNIYFLEIS